MGAVDNLLKGSIDMHVHAGPDPRKERRVDALQAAVMAQEAGMQAIVLKCHDYPTAPLAYTVGQIVPDIAVIGSISLDFEVGGLNTYALEASARLGAKVVWMPTFSSQNDMIKSGSNKEGIIITDGAGKLLPVVSELLDIIKSYRMVLCTGHISPAESFTLVEEAARRGLLKIVITHPLLERLGATLTLEEQQRMVEMGAFIEHCFIDTMPLYRYDPMKIVEAVRAVGAEHCIISSDLGQDFNPPPVEGMRMAIATMLICGLTEDEVKLMFKVNPARLLDLD